MVFHILRVRATVSCQRTAQEEKPWEEYEAGDYTLSELLKAHSHWVEYSWFSITNSIYKLSSYYPKKPHSNLDEMGHVLILLDKIGLDKMVIIYVTGSM